MQKLKVNNAGSIEGQIHQYLKNSDEARFIHRLHGILLLINSEKNNCSTIGSLFKNSPRSLSICVHNINMNGNIEVLRDKTRKGRTPGLDVNHLGKQLYCKTIILKLA